MITILVINICFQTYFNIMMEKLVANKSHETLPTFHRRYHGASLLLSIVDQIRRFATLYYAICVFE